MNKKGNTLRPDAQAFDEIRVNTIPRYKESELSGDEWRISARVEFLRNGIVRKTWVCSSVQDAAYLMASNWVEACDNMGGYFSSEEDFCDQEGCSQKATVYLKKKTDCCNHGHRTNIEWGEHIRQFCENHSTRGDAGLDDGDSNYEILE